MHYLYIHIDIPGPGPSFRVNRGVPLGAVPVLSWCGEVSLGGKTIIITPLHTFRGAPRVFSRQCG